MSAQVETRNGRCETHGAVTGTREIPRLQFPFIVFAAQRWRAKRRPFRCPECGEPVAAS